MTTIDGSLRPIFRDKLREGFHWQSIETGGTGLGVFDSNFCSQGVEGWIEFKQTEGYAVTLRPEQIGWADARARAGGRIFVGVRRWHDGGPRKGPPVDELWLLAGAAAKLMKVQGLRYDARYVMGVWGGGPAAWDWSEVKRKILGR